MSEKDDHIGIEYDREKGLIRLGVRGRVSIIAVTLNALALLAGRALGYW